MTLDDIRTLLAGVDTGIRHYFSQEKSRDYTYWEEVQRLPLMAEDRHDEAWLFYVHRYTRSDSDTVARQLFDALDSHPGIAVQYTLDYDPDTRYHHHIFRCEGY